MAVKKMTAAELMATLAIDPNHRRMVEEKEHQRTTLEAELAVDETSLVVDCANAGVAIQSVWDLVNTSDNYNAAIPVLIRHLSVSHHPKTLEGVVRALSTHEAHTAFDTLVALFKETKDSNSELKWLLGAAIAETTSYESVGRVIELILEKENGRGRAFLPLGLVHLPKDEALAKLRSLPASTDIDESIAKAVQLVSMSS